MQRIVTTLTSLFVFALLLLPAQAQTNYTVLVGSGDLPKHGTGSTERGSAFIERGAQDRYYVASRSSGNDVHAYDANDIDDLSSQDDLNMTGVSGGFFTINDLGQSDGDLLFGCNLVLNSSTDAFKCYRWDTEDAVPEVVFNQTIEDEENAGSGYRLGDKIKIVGNTTDGLELWVAAGSDNVVLRFSYSAASEVFGVPVQIQHNGGSNGSTPDVAPEKNSSGDLTGNFYVNGNGTNPRYYTLALDGETATLAGTISGTLIPTNSNALHYFRSADGNTEYLTNFIYDSSNSSDGDYGRTINVTNFPTTPATLVFDTAKLTNNSNPNGTGDVNVRINPDQTVTVFVLSTNRGIAATTSSAALPVELVSFDAVTSGSDVVVNWTTASELNSANFALEYRQGEGAFQTAAVLEAQGTTSNTTHYSHRVVGLDPGTYTFRLKQVDLDGSTAYSGLIEATVDVPEGYHLSAAYPNPFNPQTTLTLHAKQAQEVRVEVFNLLGQRVQTLFSGAMQANQQRTLTFEANGLPSGLYLIRATGETFVETQTVTLSK